MRLPWRFYALLALVAGGAYWYFTWVDKVFVV
jgi:hypothetical protein